MDAFFGEWGQDVEVLLQQLDSVVRQLPGGDSVEMVGKGAG